MNIKRLRPYLVYLGIVIYIFLYQYFYEIMMYIRARTYSAVPWFFYNVAELVLLGILFGLNPFLDHMELSGKLHVKWKQIIFIGLPLFIYILIPISAFIFPNSYLNTILETKLYGKIFLFGNAFDLCCVLFGFVMMTSIRKKTAFTETLLEISGKQEDTQA